MPTVERDNSNFKVCNLHLPSRCGKRRIDRKKFAAFFVWFSFNRGRDEFCARFVQWPPPTTCVAKNRHDFVFFLFYCCLCDENLSATIARRLEIKNHKIPTKVVLTTNVRIFIRMYIYHTNVKLFRSHGLSKI